MDKNCCTRILRIADTQKLSLSFCWYADVVKVHPRTLCISLNCTEFLKCIDDRHIFEIQILHLLRILGERFTIPAIRIFPLNRNTFYELSHFVWKKKENAFFGRWQRKTKKKKASKYPVYPHDAAWAYTHILFVCIESNLNTQPYKEDDNLSINEFQANTKHHNLFAVNRWLWFAFIRIHFEHTLRHMTPTIPWNLRHTL